MRTNPNISRLIEAATKSCRSQAARDRIEEIRIADDYGEPGYSRSDDSLPIVIGNWNSITRWQDGQCVVIDDAPERLSRILEELGFEIEWGDEWIETCVCREGQPLTLAYRCSADSYGWTPSYLEIDGEIVGDEEILADPDIEIDLCLGDPDRAVKIIGAEELEERGFAKFPEEFASGFYGGQDSDPHKIAKSLGDLGIERFVFTLDDVGQFDCHFSLWLDPEELEGLDPEELEIDSRGSDPAVALKKGLQSIPPLSRQPGQVAVHHIQGDGSVVSKSLSAQEFIEGKAL